MEHFVRRTTYVPFRRFWGMCDVKSCNVFLLLYMVLCAPISATLWDAFLFLGLSFCPLLYFLLGGFQCFIFL
jgi:hypothetical protein